MVYHMLAVFGEETARPPIGLAADGSPRIHHHHPNEVEQERHEALCTTILEACLCKSSSRRTDMLGHGSGFTFDASPYCSTASKDSVHVLFAGEVSNWPGVDAVSAAHNAFVRNDPPVEVNDAHWLLDFYSSFPEESDKDDHTERALQCLSQIQGSFAFVIYDAARRRVLASRDSNGSQPLFWGASPDGQLLFGSCLEDLSTCTPSATSFPAGILFASERTLSAYNPGDKGWVIEDEDFPGQLLSFLKSDPTHWRGVKVIPRITSKGILCGAVYKVASRAKLAF